MTTAAESDTATKTTDGWGWPMLSRKAHYFTDGMSLCRKWMFTGGPSGSQSTDEERGPDDCAQCHRKVRALLLAKKTKR